MPINYKKYPPDWRQIVKRIKARENNCCKFCNVPNGALIYAKRRRGRWQLCGLEGMELETATIVDGIKVTIIALTVAHLDRDSENWNVADDRLAALCKSCHLNYDRSRHTAKRKYGGDYFKQPKLF